MKVTPAAFAHLVNSAGAAGLDAHVAGAINALGVAQWGQARSVRAAHARLTETRRRVVNLLLTDAMAAFETYVVELVYAHLTVRPRVWSTQWTKHTGGVATKTGKAHGHTLPTAARQRGELIPCCWTAASQWALAVSAAYRREALPHTLQVAPAAVVNFPQRLFEYARTARNAVAHDDSRATSEFVAASSHAGLAAEAATLSVRGRALPAFPLVAVGDDIVFSPEHVVLMATALRRAATAFDDAFLRSLTPEEEIAYLVLAFCAYPNNATRGVRGITQDVVAYARGGLGAKTLSDTVFARGLRAHPHVVPLKQLYAVST